MIWNIPARPPASMPRGIDNCLKRSSHFDCTQKCKITHCQWPITRDGINDAQLRICKVCIANLQIVVCLVPWTWHNSEKVNCKQHANYCASKVSIIYFVSSSRSLTILLIRFLELVSEEIVCDQFDCLLRSDEENVDSTARIHSFEFGESSVAARSPRLLGTVHTAEGVQFYSYLQSTHIPLYCNSPLGPGCWFCSRVLTRSMGKTQDTPTTPAKPPFRILGKYLKETWNPQQ